MEIFLGIIVFILGWACGEYYGLGRPRIFLPPKATILNVEAASDYVFLAKYRGRVTCFKANDRWITKGHYEILIVDTPEGKKKILRQVKN